MKGITLFQPWATLIARYYKRYETRSWETSYRGAISIHAGKTFQKDMLTLYRYDTVFAPIPANEHRGGEYRFPEATDLPRGKIIAIANLVDVQPALKVMASLDPHNPMTWDEREFGNWHRDTFAWKLECVRRLSEPIVYRGTQGLWNVKSEAVALIESQIEMTIGEYESLRV